MTWAWWEVERLVEKRPTPFRAEEPGDKARLELHGTELRGTARATRRPYNRTLATRAFWIAVPGLLSMGCAAAAGAGVAVAALGAAVATSECYGYVDVLVTEATTGTRQCDATVNARQGDSVVPFRSCFYAPLTKGKWQLSVDKPGYESVKSEIQINPEDNCRRIVHHVSVRLDSLNAPPRAPFGDAAEPSQLPTPPQAPPPPPPATPAPPKAEPPADAAGDTTEPTPGPAPEPPQAPQAPADSAAPDAAAPPPSPKAPPTAPPPAAPAPAPTPSTPAPPVPAKPPPPAKPPAPTPPGSAEPNPPSRSFPAPG